MLAQLKVRLVSVIAVFCVLTLSLPVFANPQLALIPGARVNMNLLPPRSVQSKAFSYPHQVTVALPASYAAQPDRRYPVLWVLDEPLIMRSVVGLLDVLVIGNLAPEMIVIGVGSPSEEGLRGVGRRVIGRQRLCPTRLAERALVGAGTVAGLSAQRRRVPKFAGG